MLVECSYQYTSFSSRKQPANAGSESTSTIHRKCLCGTSTDHIDACAYKMPSCSGIQNVNQKLQVQYAIVMTAMIISGWITDDCEYAAFFLITGLPELCIFSANYAPKIPNYVQIMRIVQYCTIFLRKNSQCFSLLRLQIKHKHLINI